MATIPTKHPRRTDERPFRWVVIYQPGPANEPAQIVSDSFATQPEAAAWIDSLGLPTPIKNDLHARKADTLTFGTVDTRASFAAEHFG